MAMLESEVATDNQRRGYDKLSRSSAVRVVAVAGDITMRFDLSHPSRAKDARKGWGTRGLVNGIENTSPSTPLRLG